MKNLLTIFCLSFIMGLSHAADNNTKQTPRYKTICKNVIKDNRTVKECKTIRVHKKLNGTKVPEKQRK